MDLRFISHIHTGIYMLLQMRPSMGLLESAAYLFGSVQPDVCMKTYVMGVAPGDEGRGHNFRTAMLRIERLLENYEGGGGIVSAYRLGKISHYAADIFTYPHNPHLFRGSLKDHMKYERKLNRYLKSYLASGNVRLNVRFTTDVLGELRARHDEYEEMEHSPETDTSCILSALALVYLLGYVPAPALLSSAV